MNNVTNIAQHQQDDLKRLQKEVKEFLDSMPYGDISMGIVSMKMHNQPNISEKIKYLKEVLKGREVANELGKATSKLAQQLPKRVPDNMDGKLKETILNELKSGKSRGRIFTPNEEMETDK